MARDIGPRIGIEGEDKYRKEIKEIITQAKTLDAEMKAVASSFDKEADAKKKNAAVSEQLNKQIKNQQELVAKYADMVEKSAKANGENSEVTQKWAQKLYNAQAELNRLEHGLDTATEKSNVFKDTLKAMLSKEAIIGGLTALKDGFESIAKAAVSFGKEVVTAYADFEQLEGGVKKLFGEDDAATVIRNAQQAFKTAGMSANEYMETVTSFSASLISSLGKDTKEAARLADVAIRDMSDNANTFGSDIQSIQNAYQGFAKGQFNMLDNLRLGYGGTKTEMERLLVDAEKIDNTFKAQRDTNGDLALSFDDIVRAIHIVQTDMKITGTTANEAAGTISGSISTMKSAFQNFVTGLGMNNADIDMLLGNLVEAFQNVVTNIQPIIERLIDYIPGVIAAVIPVLQGMAPDLIRTAVELFNSFVSAIISVLPDLIPVAVDAIIMFANTIVTNLPTIIDAGIQFILALVNGLAEALPDLLEQAPRIIGHFVSSIVKNLPMILEVGARLIMSLAEGMATNFGGILQAGWDVLTAIRDTFGEGIKAALSWGKDMMINFGNGIAQAASHVWENVKGVASGIKKILGFSEPDEGPLSNFHTFAPDMMKLFAKGITDNQHLVTDAASQAMEGVSAAMNAGNATSNAYNFGGFNISVYQQPGESTDELVDRLMYQMQNRVDSRKAVFA